MSVSQTSSRSGSNRSRPSHGSKPASLTKAKRSSSTKSSLECYDQESVQSEVVPGPQFKSILEQARSRRKPTLDEYRAGSMGKQSLFSKVVSLDSASDTLVKEIDEEPSILVSGFGLRNLRSLQDALRAEEEKRLLELYKHQTPVVEETIQETKEIASHVHSFSPSSSTSTREISTESAGTETDLTTAQSDISEQKLQLEYLMGLQHQAVEEQPEVFDYQPRKRKDFVYSRSPSMQEAQRYLHTHRIFDFFQFITAHLLGALPDNPFEFIIELLNKCLLYRAGLGQPPLLFNENHILQLFKLMDRMNSGFIELEQYKQGMMTLGVCEYNKCPQLSPDNMVSKEIFVEEAYRGELILFNDLIKERKSRKTVLQDELQKLSVNGLSGDPAGPYFIPSELFRSLEKERKPEGRKSAHLGMFEEG